MSLPCWIVSHLQSHICQRPDQQELHHRSELCDTPRLSSSPVEPCRKGQEHVEWPRQRRLSILWSELCTFPETHIRGIADRQDACAYTDCPIPANVTNQYTYEFVTLNDVCHSLSKLTSLTGQRFDQLTFNITNGFEGPSMFCSYFPVTL